MLRAVVFDFDGVIADSEPLHFRGYRDVLAAEGVELTEGEYYTRYLGFDDVGAFERIGSDQGRTWTPAHIRDLVARKAALIEELEHDVSVLFPGAAAAVRKAAADMPVAIASGARGAEIRRVLERERLTSYFTVIVAAEDTRLSKPAPDPYLRALALLGPSAGGQLNAADCVAIEDSRWGLESARAAGLRTVAVASTYDSIDLGPLADLVIPSLERFDLRQIADLCS